MKIKLAILFWFYKNIDVCENRLKLLKKYNPNSKIYGLYGGPKEQESNFKFKLNKYLDDFYTMPEKNSFKKWICGDIYLLDWYKNRGQKFQWDSIVMVQWDLLAFESVETLFKGIKENEVFLPYYHLIDKNKESSWYWTSLEIYKKTGENNPKRPYMRNNYLKFKKHIKKQYHFTKPIPLITFMFAVFPKIFFEKYKQVKNIEIGFLEYKIPTYVELFKLDLFKKDFGESDNKSINKIPMNAASIEIKREYIKNELKKKKGWRVFHPYYQKY